MARPMGGACCANSVAVSRTRSGAPRTVRAAVEPANIASSKPICSAIRADSGSNTDAGCTQPASRMLRNFRRRAVHDIAVFLPLNAEGLIVGRSLDVDTQNRGVLQAKRSR